jgi:hypothetical protein
MLFNFFLGLDSVPFHQMLSQSASIFKERRPAQNALILGIHFIDF